MPFFGGENTSVPMRCCVKTTVDKNTCPPPLEKSFFNYNVGREKFSSKRSPMPTGSESDYEHRAYGVGVDPPTGVCLPGANRWADYVC